MSFDMRRIRWLNSGPGGQVLDPKRHRSNAGFGGVCPLTVRQLCRGSYGERSLGRWRGGIAPHRIFCEGRLGLRAISPSGLGTYIRDEGGCRASGSRFLIVVYNSRSSLAAAVRWIMMEVRRPSKGTGLADAVSVENR